MTAELHYPAGGGRPHVLTDDAGMEALRAAAGPAPAPKPWDTLTGPIGRLDAIDVYRGRCPCHDDQGDDNGNR